MYFNSDLKAENTYDAIVVGSGISGGWAAKELTEKGLKVLVLERGRMVKHGEYPTAALAPWQLPNGNRLTQEELKIYEKQNRTGVTQATKHWWVKDTESPYTEIKRFDWIRGYHVGGRSIMWGRHSYRHSDIDFTANAKDGHGTDWPIRYKDIAPWYSYAEKFIGVSGQKEGLEQLPDGEYLPPMEHNCVEKSLRGKIMEKFPGRVLSMGRVANLTQAHNGRGKCQFRNLCNRGCPYGAYFSSLSSTLPAAEKTGNLTIRPNSIVNTLLFDSKARKATGVRILDAETKESSEFHAKIIFLCASALNSTWILMNSTSDEYPDGLGSSSGELGHNLMDHHFRAGASGEISGFDDMYYLGRKPSGIYMPRFRNIGKDVQKDFLRGFGYQGGASRQGWQRSVKELGFGEDLKDQLATPGPWTMGFAGFGETLPYHENKIMLNKDLLDKWGQPTLTMDCEFKENEMKMRQNIITSAAEMLEASGAKNIKLNDPKDNTPGLGIHEMGTARMGTSPKNSVLNKHNQVWDCTNVYVTDGAAMTSAACVNPSLTYMALTARAAEHAVSELKRMNL
ncbi:MAG: GMC family oxidoreductase [Saprospiraceae bacterium]